MILLDTNVISEVMKPFCDTAVLNWVSAQSDHDLYISSITVAEILYGVGLLPTGKRKARLERDAAAIVESKFPDRILPFDKEAAEAYGRLASQRQKSGFDVKTLDLQIAAIADVYGASVATRNVRDFSGCGVTLINPWEAG